MRENDRTSPSDYLLGSVANLAQAISCSNVHGDFPVHECSHPFSWLPIARVKMQCTLPCPGRRLHLRMVVLRMVLAMTSM